MSPIELPAASHALRVGLIGYGIWGRKILRDLIRLGHPVVVVEPREAARRESVTSGAAEAVSATGALGPVSGIVVASPAVTHAEILEEVLPRGVPVLCEKPLTTDGGAARRVAELGGDRLFVGHVWCYHPGVQALREIARSGELGPVHGLRTARTNWTSPRTDVDTVWNLVPHDLSLARFVLGEIPEPRFALAEVLDGRCVGMIGVLGSSPWVVFDASNRFREKRREVRLHCRGGVAVLRDPDSGQIEITRSGADGAAELETRAVSTESALFRELRAFSEHLRGGPPPPTTGGEGALVVEGVERLRALAGLD